MEPNQENQDVEKEELSESAEDTEQVQQETLSRPLALTYSSWKPPSGPDLFGRMKYILLELPPFPIPTENLSMILLLQVLEAQGEYLHSIFSKIRLYTLHETRPHTEIDKALFASHVLLSANLKLSNIRSSINQLEAIAIQDNPPIIRRINEMRQLLDKLDLIIQRIIGFAGMEQFRQYHPSAGEELNINADLSRAIAYSVYFETVVKKIRYYRGELPSAITAFNSGVSLQNMHANTARQKLCTQVLNLVQYIDLMIDQSNVRPENAGLYEVTYKVLAIMDCSNFRLEHVANEIERSRNLITQRLQEPHPDAEQEQLERVLQHLGQLKNYLKTISDNIRQIEAMDKLETNERDYGAQARELLVNSQTAAASMQILTDHQLPNY